MQMVLLRLLCARQGHFQLESGHQGSPWLEPGLHFLRLANHRFPIMQMGGWVDMDAGQVVYDLLAGSVILAQAPLKDNPA